MRMTNHMRGKICCAVLTHRFKPIQLELIKTENTLAHEAYNTVFGGKNIKQMYALPKGWLPEEPRIGIVFNDASSNRLYLYFNGHGYKVYENNYIDADFVDSVPTIHMRFPSNVRDSWQPELEADSDFCRAVTNMINARKEFFEIVKTTSKQVAATLDKFSTIEKLLEAWPDVKPFTVGVAPEPVANLPMVPVKQLNDLLGLPV